MKPVGVILFPGTQCDQDTIKAVYSAGLKAKLLWYQDFFDYKNFSALILPGGFSYGDYLRAGALAAHSPSMKSVREAVQKGWPVLGICNGFQILCESRLLPGVLTSNTSLKFIDRWVFLKKEASSPYWSCSGKEQMKLPIAHSEGRYFISSEGLKELKDHGQIWLTYKENPNGSIGGVAGVLNKKKNAAGLMPHPERAMEDWMGSSDGFSFFSGFAGH